MQQNSLWGLRLSAVGVLLMLMSVYASADTIDTTGQAAYEQCGYCHEYDGNPRMPMFPRLAGQWPGYLKKQLEDFRSGARTGQMTATAELLSDQDIAEVVAYFSAQTPRPLPLSEQDETAARRAQNLYLQGDVQRGLNACAECHGDKAQGRPGFPALAGQQPDYMKTQLRAFRSGERSNDPGGQMPRLTALLTETEMDELADYLARLAPRQVTTGRIQNDSGTVADARALAPVQQLD